MHLVVSRYVIINDDSEKPNINPLIYNRKTLIKIPIIVNPNIHIINEYDILVIILFLNANILFIFWLSIFDINVLILSITKFLSFISMMVENIAPDVTPNSNIIITKKLIFLLGNNMLLILLNLFIIVSPS